MAGVRFEALSKTYPGRRGAASVEVIRQLDLTIKDGEFLVLVGPSGCGKSTLLRLLAGLETPSNGEIFIGDHPVSRMRPGRRDVAMVFQSYALYPHLSVRDNLSFGLRRSRSRTLQQQLQDHLCLSTRRLPAPFRIRSQREASIAARVDKVATALELEPLLDRLPRSSRWPEATGRPGTGHGPGACRFLMDEPLSNLDAKLRNSTRTRIVDLQRQLGTTTVYVTHDQVEAMTMGHRIAVLNRGDCNNSAHPWSCTAGPQPVRGPVHWRPPMNLLPVIVGAGSTLLLGEKRLQVDSPWQPLAKLEGETLTAGLRPKGGAFRPPPTAISRHRFCTAKSWVTNS